ncbi:ubiquinone/menaquinone biosynthesis C-methylase UbiE [Neobacillus niacini]|uniref:class I SAM-dependent methyltransferase n=1 Tax=Neobacillus driksii TaxID=3035913 RepID=UPI00278A9BA5|nr:class I SAM-dependent methyltransferase [Neobacillus niacini]MDQ0970473.1 ubiquinone/menaquinone biosynthesis C-methylase UbiE [Neobacillus niacini]
MELIDRVKGIIDNQYRKPKGLIGTYIGEKMVRQHKPETLWTIKLLNIQQSESVLELGCGAGYAMKLILEQSIVGKVVGLDLSPTVIRSAMIRNKKALNNEKAKLVQANVKSLPFDDEQFDKVFSIHTIYFWDELAATLSEIFRVLKPGSVFILTFCDGENGEIWDDISSLIDEQLIPIMKNKGFFEVALVKGPNSRQFHTVAVSGKKEL